LSRVKLIGSNVLTALVTAAVTSAFWVVAFNNGKVERAAADSAASGGRGETGSASGTGAGSRSEIFLGPTGLAIPVAGVNAKDLIDTYKQARAGGARVHDAIDIMAPHGTPVVSAAPGKVEKMFFSQGGGGVTAYVRSPDSRYIFYYAHLQDYAPGLREGQTIAQGDPIGTVGSTGNANPGGPHLHFAIHRMRPGEPWHSGQAVNPYPLLVGNPTRR
jgi:murein DD-endopeptidase MepM/ murein hydrolase activator NlpD